MRVNLISDPEIQPAKLFDNVWALGDQGTTVYAVVTPDGIVLIDALYPDKYEKTLLPQMARAGLDPAQVKYVLVTHGHADHFGGAAFFQQKYGAKVALSAIDWELVEKARMPEGHPAPRRDVETRDGEAITVGGMAFTPGMGPGPHARIAGLDLPGHGRRDDAHGRPVRLDHPAQRSSDDG